MTYAWRSALYACRLRFLEIRGRFCLSSRLIDWEGFLRKQRVLSIQDSLQLCAAGTPFLSIADALQGADPAHFGYCSRRQYGLLFLQLATRALMGRTIIAAVGTIAKWAIYSSPSLPRITESCGGMLRIPAVARAAAVQLSHSFAISPSRNFIFSPLTPRETNGIIDTDPSERTSF